MRKCCLVVALFPLAFRWLVSVEAAPPKKQANLDADKLAAGKFTGTLVSTPDADRMFTVNVVYQKLQLKPGQNLGRANQNLQRQYNRIVQLQNQLMRPGQRNPAGIMQQLNDAIVQFQLQAARTQANMFQAVTVTQKVDFQAEENVKVRIKDLPEQFDDKGNIKKCTREELAELKGKDKNLPGYESSIDNLKPSQIVQVTLGVHQKPKAKPAPSTLPSSSAATDKDADKDKGKDASIEHKMQVRMIVILKDTDAPPNSMPPPNKKNKVTVQPATDI